MPPFDWNEQVFKVVSYAKINRSLRILGKRLDGYHEIDTILQTVSLHDDITFTRREDQEIVLNCDNPEIPTTRDRSLKRKPSGVTCEKKPVRAISSE